MLIKAIIFVGGGFLANWLFKRVVYPYYCWKTTKVDKELEDLGKDL